MTLIGNPVGRSIANQPLHQQAPVLMSSANDVHFTTITQREDKLSPRQIAHLD